MTWDTEKELIHVEIERDALVAERDRYKAALGVKYEQAFKDWLTEEKPTFEEWLERLVVRAQAPQEDTGDA